MILHLLIHIHIISHFSEYRELSEKFYSGAILVYFEIHYVVTLFDNQKKNFK